MTSNSPNSFERLGEYTTLLEDSASISNRRQGTNEVLIGFNLAILSGIGFLLLTTHFHTWALPGVILLISAIMTPINWAWRRTLAFYQKLIAYRLAYLTEIEQEFRDRTGNMSIGLFIRMKKDLYGDTRRSGTTHTERRIAAIFVFVYPILTVLVSVLTALEIFNVIPQLMLQ
jgi:hypothetical protein